MKITATINLNLLNDIRAPSFAPRWKRKRSKWEERAARIRISWYRWRAERENHIERISIRAGLDAWPRERAAVCYKMAGEWVPVDGTRLLWKHEGFSANPWCLWVSDISYIQTEDLEDPDEGEYPVHVRARIFYESDRCRRTRATVERARLLQVGSTRFHAWRPSWQRAHLECLEIRARVSRDAWHAWLSRCGMIPTRPPPPWISRLGSRCAAAAAARDRACHGRREYFGGCKTGWVSHGTITPVRTAVICRRCARGATRFTKSRGGSVRREGAPRHTTPRRAPCLSRREGKKRGWRATAVTTKEREREREREDMRPRRIPRRCRCCVPTKANVRKRHLKLNFSNDGGISVRATTCDS